ncbi:MAG: hypothetical protein AAB152_15685 [Candidatus Coatesbacteria bacterium]
MKDYAQLFEKLIHAEHEDEVTEIIEASGYLIDDPAIWLPLCGFDNNISVVSNQASKPGAAMVEKIINSIDALLMAKCFSQKVDPEGPHAPKDMAEAVEKFFGVKAGRIEALSPKQQTELASNIHVVVTGSKSDPCYMVVDKGEGQTPASFPTTLLGFQESNKMKIPFVQGKFHSGGTGVLQNCGTQNYELIVSKRHPDAPVKALDTSSGEWGFTLVRRIRPTGTQRSSRYVYLAPDGRVPSFKAASINALPGTRSGDKTPLAYDSPLSYGTCIKLYNYRWRAHGLATLETRFELEQYLHAPCLPFRVTETRKGYKANYFSTTVAGVWASIGTRAESGEPSSSKLEEEPTYGELNLKGIGRLPYTIVVFKEDVDTRRVPNGVCYTLNGQVHGRAPADFITRKLEFAYLADSMLVSVDCVQIDPAVREDWIHSSRDRTRDNETDRTVLDALAEALRSHPGLRRLNALRKQKEVESSLKDDKEGLDFLQQLLNRDSTLSTLLGFGSRLVTKTGPGDVPTLFKGRKFPTYFRLAKEPKGGLAKHCPINKLVSVEFETDAENDYFRRADSPGAIMITPADLCEYSQLWNGRFTTRFRAPWNAKPGDSFDIAVQVSDVERDATGHPFTSKFTIVASPEDERKSPPGPSPTPHRPRSAAPTSGLTHRGPQFVDVRRDQWKAQKPEEFTEQTALRIKPDGEGGYVFYLNLDNTYLLTELTRGTEAEKTVAMFHFRWGLVLCAMGMLVNLPGKDDNHGNASDAKKQLTVDDIGKCTDGIARVIVPLVRQLYRGPD